MICPKCFLDREEVDFLQKDTCYKCQYEHKVANSKQFNRRRCKNCGGDLSSNKWSYCCERCAYVRTKKLKDSHWTKLVK